MSSPDVSKPAFAGRSNERGFSLIELLSVAVIIGVIAAIAIPSLRKGIIAAENGSVFATIRTISSTEVRFYATNNRFGRLDEMNNELSRSIGILVAPNQIQRRDFLFEMVPASPTDTELHDGYTITATRNVPGDPMIYKYELTETGVIRQILP